MKFRSFLPPEREKLERGLEAIVQCLLGEWEKSVLVEAKKKADVGDGEKGNLKEKEAASRNWNPEPCKEGAFSIWREGE